MQAHCSRKDLAMSVFRLLVLLAGALALAGCVGGGGHYGHRHHRDWSYRHWGTTAGIIIATTAIITGGECCPRAAAVAASRTCQGKDITPMLLSFAAKKRRLTPIRALAMQRGEGGRQLFWSNS